MIKLIDILPEDKKEEVKNWAEDCINELRYMLTKEESTLAKPTGTVPPTGIPSVDAILKWLVESDIEEIIPDSTTKTAIVGMIAFLRYNFHLDWEIRP